MCVCVWEEGGVLNLFDCAFCYLFLWCEIKAWRISGATEELLSKMQALTLLKMLPIEAASRLRLGIGSLSTLLGCCCLKKPQNKSIESRRGGEIVSKSVHVNSCSASFMTVPYSYFGSLQFGSHKPGIFTKPGKLCHSLLPFFFLLSLNSCTLVLDYLTPKY